MSDRPQRYEPAVPIDSIHPHPENVNEGDVGAITESLDANGWYGAVLVQESSGRIIAGKHRWLSAKHQGRETVPVIFIDVDDDRARRIMLADNAITRKGRDEARALANLLEALAATDDGLTGTGYDGDDLDQLLKELEAPLGGGPGEFPDVDPDDMTFEHTCPKCGFEF